MPDVGELARKIAHQRERITQLLRRGLESRVQRVDHLLARIQSQRPQVRLAHSSERLVALGRRLHACSLSGLERRRSRLAQLHLRLVARHPASLLQQRRAYAKDLRSRLGASAAQAIERRRSRLGELARTLNAVSPLATLERGYAILFDPASGTVVRSVADATTGAPLRARLADGSVEMTVVSKRQA